LLIAATMATAVVFVAVVVVVVLKRVIDVYGSCMTKGVLYTFHRNTGNHSPYHYVY